MKKLVIAFVALLSTTFAVAQEFGEGSNRLHLGIGVGSAYAYSGSTSSIPPVHASFEHGITDKIGVGAIVGYTASTWEQSFLSTTYEWKFTYLLVGARGAYHFKTDDKIDLYGGAMLGYNIASAKFESNDASLNAFITEPKVGGVAVGAFVGGRYNFNEKIGIFGELGYNIAYLSAGLCFNLN